MNTFLSKYQTHLVCVQGLSELSVQAYLSDVRIFLNFITEIKITELTEVEPKHLSDFLANQSKKNKALATRKREIAALKSYFQFLIENNICAKSPCEHLPKLRLPKRSPADIPFKMIDKLQHAWDKDSIAVWEIERNRALVLCLFSTGARISELLALNIADFQLATDMIVVLGKRQKERMVFLAPPAIAALQKYLNARQVSFPSNEQKLPLFISRRNRRLNRNQAWHILKAGAGKCKLPVDRIYPHCLRHTFATTMVNHGAGLREVQELMGHTNINSTEKYLHANFAHLQKIHARTHPHGKAEGRDQKIK